MPKRKQKVTPGHTGHTEHEVTIKWKPGAELEEALVSVGNIVDFSAEDERVIFSFTKAEWRKVKQEVKQTGEANCGDFYIVKIYN